MVDFLSIINKKPPLGFVKGDEEYLMELELVEGIKHNLTTTITRNKGNINTTTDNIKNNPISLDLVCRISNNPVSLAANISGLATSVLPSNPLFQRFANEYKTELTNSYLKKTDDRRKDFFKKLLEIRDNKIPFNVVTGLKSYQNMFFTAITAEENKDSENCLVFSCSLEEVKLKSSSTVSTTGTEAKKKSGLQKPVPVEEGSVLYDFLSKFRG